MPTEPATAAAPAQAAPPAPAPKHLPLFDPPPTEDPAPTVEITEADPEAEVKPDDKPAATEPARPPAFDAAAAAKAWQEQQRAEAEKARVSQLEAEHRKDRAELERLRRFAKEDKRLLLQELGVDFKDLSKEILNGPPPDARVIDMAARLEKAESALAEVPKVLAQRDFQLFMHQTQGKIAAALETGTTYEQARAVGWTPEKVWERMATEAQRTGQIPSHSDVLAKIEEEELAKLEKATGTSKAREKGYTKAAPATQGQPAAKVATPSKTLNNSMSEAPARTEKKRNAEDVIRDFLKSGKKLRD